MSEPFSCFLLNMLNALDDSAVTASVHSPYTRATPWPTNGDRSARYRVALSGRYAIYRRGKNVIYVDHFVICIGSPVLWNHVFYDYDLLVYC